MGAVLIKEGMHQFIDDPDYIAEVKYDGYRMLGWLGKKGARYTTRSVGVDSIRAGNPAPTERTDNVPHLRDLKHDLEGTIIDGEFWKPGCRSHDITSMIGGSVETSIANQEREGYVIYVIYDVLQYKGVSTKYLNYTTRRNLIENEITPHLVKNNPEKEQYIRISEIIPHGEKVTRYDEVVQAGGEGLILKHKESHYHEGKIDKNGKGIPAKIKASNRNGLEHTPWIKWKKYDTFDCVIMGFSPATIEYTGNEIETWQYWEDSDEVKLKLYGVDKAVEYSHAHGITVRAITKFYYHGWPGAITFGQYKDGKLIEVGNTSGIKDNLRKDFAENPESFIGRVIEVGAMERIKKTNALREPRLIAVRPEWDKQPHECTIK
jgi:hypothetical protein